MTDAWSLQARNSSRDGRHALGALLGSPAGAPMTWSTGVLPSTTVDGAVADLRVLPTLTPGNSVRVLPGHAVITRPSEGPYVCWSAATLTAPTDPADATNARIDAVVARLWDPALGDPATLVGPVVEVITGRPSPTPARPEIPANAVALAYLNRPAGATMIDASHVVDARRGAFLRGGVRLLLAGDDPREPGSYPGQYRHRAGLEYWDGQSWRGTLAPPPGSTSVVERRGHTESELLIASLVMPDPGWPYVITATGAAEVIASDQDGENVPTGRADLAVRLDNLDGPQLGIGVGPDTVGLGRRSMRPTLTHPGHTGVLTGSHIVHLVIVRTFGDPNFRMGSTRFNGSLMAQVMPA
ncbi:hypothetical protein M8C13_06305 [Crossiella sp. SN42]|uniref:hypothetical protein n=1 Tax=Crossiella sp. SN42 TaxID=2944808 RepID=UPI00207CD209|nr:hypothetical protein [Crossiella sp. SN42]MCO1575372.1 hypothetical protein [Crossiella sp. SN42]